MGLSTLITSFPWERYSKKLMAKMERPRCSGFFTKEEAEQRGMKGIIGSEGSVRDGNRVVLYWLVDPQDGVIVDAKFQVFGQSALLGAAEAACEILVSKNYDQAKRISTDLIDKQVRDRADEPAFPKEAFLHLNMVLEAIDQAAGQCEGIPLAAHYVAPPVSFNVGEISGGGYPGWMELPQEQKIAVLEDVLNQDVRPYIALDAGGVELLRLQNNHEVIIVYQGSCTSCMSSVGATLSYIQHILRQKVHPDLVVIPDFDHSS